MSFTATPAELGEFIELVNTVSKDGKSYRLLVIADPVGGQRATATRKASERWRQEIARMHSRDAPAGRERDFRGWKRHCRNASKFAQWSQMPVEHQHFMMVRAALDSGSIRSVHALPPGVRLDGPDLPSEAIQLSAKDIEDLFAPPLIFEEISGDDEASRQRRAAEAGSYNLRQELQAEIWALSADAGDDDVFDNKERRENLPSGSAKEDGDSGA